MAVTQPSSPRQNLKQPTPHGDLEPDAVGASDHGASMGCRFGRILLAFLGLVFLVTTTIVVLLLIFPNMLPKQVIVNQLEHRLNRKVEIQNLRLSLFPSVRLELFGVAVREAESSEPVFRANRTELALRLILLLRQQPRAVERLAMDEPWLLVRRDGIGRWTIPAITGMDQAMTKEEPSNSEQRFPVKEIRVSRGAVIVVDDFRRDESNLLSITDLQAALSFNSQAEKVGIQVSAVLPSAQPLSTFTMVGTLSRTDPVDLMGPGPAMEFDGTIQAGAIDLGRLAALFFPLSRADALEGTAHVGAELRVTPGQDGYDLVLRQLNLETGAIGLQGSGRASAMGTDKPSYSLTLSSSPVTITQLLRQIPAEWLPQQWEELWSKRKPTGTLELLGATITSSTPSQDRLPIEWTAEVRLTQGQFLFDSERIPVRDLSSRILLDADRIQADELSGWYGPVRVVGGTLVVFDVRRSPALDVSVTGTSNAAGIAQLLPALLPSGRLAQSVRSLKEIGGDMDLSVHLAGPLSDHGIRLVEADVVAREVSFYAPELRSPIRHLNGRLVITPDSLHTERLYGKVGAASMDVSGRIKLGGSPRFQNVNFEAKADAEELIPGWVSLPGDPGNRYEGPVYLKAKLSGPVALPRVTGVMTLDEMTLSRPDLFHKERGVPASVEFAAELSRGERLGIRKMDLIMPPMRIGVQGWVHLADHPSIEAHIRSQPWRVSRLPAGLSLGPLRKGRLSMALDVKGPVSDWIAWQMSGWFQLEEGLVKVDQFDRPVRDMSLRLELSEDDLRVQQAGFAIGDSDLRATGTIRQWRESPHATLQITSSRLDLDALTPREAVRREAGAPQDGPFGAWLTAMVLDASVRVADAHYERLHFSDLSCRVHATQGGFRINRLNARTEEGHINGRLTVQTLGGAAPSAEGSLRFVGIPVRRVVDLFSEKENMLRGLLALRGTVRMPLGEPSEIRQGITSLGDIHVRIEQGKIKGMPLLSRLLKIVNLPALVRGVDPVQAGLPFDRVAGVFTVEGGTVNVKQLYLEGPVLKISAAGRYNLVADRLDVVMATSPLESYSETLRNLPLIGRLFAGERRGIGTTMFDVKGSLAEPEIQVLPMKTIAGGLRGFAKLAYDIVTNTLTLPADLFEQAAGSPDHEGG